MIVLLNSKKEEKSMRKTISIFVDMLQRMYPIFGETVSCISFINSAERSPIKTFWDHHTHMYFCRVPFIVEIHV